MDQNIIILVLILIAILVSFYATYLSMDNSRKIRRLQNDIRETLGNINSTLNIEKPNPTPPIPKTESRTNLQDLDQFPSLEEIENYDAQRIMDPIDPELKKELDGILTDDNKSTGEEAAENNSKEEVVEGSNEEANEVGEEVEVSEDVVEDRASVAEEVVQEGVVEIVKENNLGEELVVEETNLDEVLSANNDQELVREDETYDLMEELKASELNVNELVAEPSNAPSEIPPLTLNESNLLEQLEALDPETLAQKNKVDAETESVVESVMGEADKKKVAEFPPLDELTQDILQKMHDKNVKLICKREGLKVRGTKVERISRILEAKEYKINVN